MTTTLYLSGLHTFAETSTISSQEEGDHVRRSNIDVSLLPSNPELWLAYNHDKHILWDILIIFTFGIFSERKSFDAKDPLGWKQWPNHGHCFSFCSHTFPLVSSLCMRICSNLWFIMSWGLKWLLATCFHLFLIPLTPSESPWKRLLCTQNQYSIPDLWLVWQSAKSLEL